MFVVTARELGLFVMVLFAAQGAFVLLSPGSMRLQKPSGGLVSWLYNLLNLSATLVLTPLVAFTLLKGWQIPGEWIGLDLGPRLLHTIAGWAGMGAYAAGMILMCWSRVVLGRSFRLGAVPPGEADRLIVAGPFRWVRHPMYSAVILVTLGMALAVRSYVFLFYALAIAATFVKLIPSEEATLRHAYADYPEYAARTRRLIPYVL